MADLKVTARTLALAAAWALCTTPALAAEDAGAGTATVPDAGQAGTAAAPAAGLAADDEGNSFHLGGYVRTWASFNLQNIPETPSNDAGELSMLRGSLMLDADATTGPVKWKAVGRLDRELETGYLQELQNLRANPAFPTTHGSDANIMANYDTAQIRELWGEFALGDRTTVRLGRQQIVWGESDFFHAMDVVHGYDYTWRLFLEPENEEWRKPLWLANFKFDVPEAAGQMQVFVRPGLDRCEDIGNTYDIAGGRWFFQPYRGFDLTSVATVNCSHPDARQDDVTGGVRWSGTASSLNYSLAYIRTFSADPVANSIFAPWHQRPNAPLFDLIHPKINVYGATVSGYSSTLDTVISAEVAFTQDQPYNVGTGALTAPDAGAAAGLGLGGIKQKDVVTSMLRFDKNLNFESWLGTNRPSLSSIQIFDTWVRNWQASDDLVRLFAYGAPLTQHSTILTVFTVLNFNGDTINPGFAAGTDLNHGGGFAIPSVDFTLGDKWRAKVEADLFWARATSNALFSPNPGVQLFGYFANNSQLLFRLTRQF